MIEYIKAPHKHLKNGEADLIFVDGRERIDCALASAKLLQDGGLLMIHDFWPRTRYRDRLPELLGVYDYLFETPGGEGESLQGMAVFQKKTLN
ncbi:MAG: hypothetical protein ACJAVK_002422 [Akkermansiaceae bacterium]|jgi:hypothetical protein